MKHTLSNGGTLEDYRSLQCGIIVKGCNFPNCRIEYASGLGIYIYVDPNYLQNIEDLDSLVYDLQQARVLLIEINELLNN